MSARMPMDIVRKCENVLGWDPSQSGKKDPDKQRRIMAKLLRDRMVANPRTITIANLELAVEYLHRQRQPIRSPLFLPYVVPDALKLAHQPIPATPIAVQIETALRQEKQTLDDPRSHYWIGRLNRSRGKGREETLAEWRAERGQP